MFKKLFYGMVAAFIATASFPPLLPVCITGSKAQMAGLREAQERNPRAFSHQSLNGNQETQRYSSRVPARPTNTMIPGNRRILPRDAQPALIPRPESLDQQAQGPAYAQKQATAPRSSEVPELPFQQKLKKEPLTEQQSVLKSLLSPFAYASSTLRAIDPFTYINRFVMKCVRGVTSFFGKRMIEPEMEQMAMPILHMAIGMAVKPVMKFFITPKTTEYITSSFIQGGVSFAGNATGNQTIQRSSRFIGTFLTEFFMNKASAVFNENIYLLQNKYAETSDDKKAGFIKETGLPFNNKEELLQDTYTSRMIILSGNVVHLLGDLHNLLFTRQTPGSDTLDKYLRMSESVINLADYALYSYKNTTQSALDDNMKKYFDKTLEYTELIKQVHAQLTEFKKQADDSGMAPMLNMILGITPDLEALQPNAEMLTGQMNPMAQMMAMAGQ